jgi:hypothetical protein
LRKSVDRKVPEAIEQGVSQGHFNSAKKVKEVQMPVDVKSLKFVKTGARTMGSFLSTPQVHLPLSATSTYPVSTHLLQITISKSYDILHLKCPLHSFVRVDENYRHYKNLWLYRARATQDHVMLLRSPMKTQVAVAIRRIKAEHTIAFISIFILASAMSVSSTRN